MQAKVNYSALTPNTKNKLRQWVNTIGLCVSLLAAVWFFYQLIENNALSSTAWRQSSFWNLILFSAIAYAISGLLLGAAWSVLIGPPKVDKAHTYKSNMAIYGFTQIYKYLPSNVLHLFGRHTLQQSLGYTHSRLALSAVLEFLLLSLTATLLIFLFYDQSLSSETTIRLYLPEFANAWPLKSTALLLAIVFGVASILLFNKQNYNQATQSKLKPITRFALSVILYTVFFMISVCLLNLLALHLQLVAEFKPSQFIFPLLLAWLIGTYIPGSPAGAGVRELILVALLSQMGATDAASIAVLGYRIVTVLGDTVLAGINYLVLKKLSVF